MTIRRQTFAEFTHAAADLAETAVAEMLWPTRCALCDAPGALLCARCSRLLGYIDRWRACPRCGAPYGCVQCSECTATLLAPLGFEEPPYDSLASAVVYDEAARRLISAYKDKGEQRLARILAEHMARYLAPHLQRNAASAPRAIGFVPATPTAVAKRGFDHVELLGRQLGTIVGLPALGLFERPLTLDQRELSRRERLCNLQGAVHVLPNVRIPSRVLLIDDVCTTGATLFAASAALKQRGATAVHCLTFARTW